MVLPPPLTNVFPIEDGSPSSLLLPLSGFAAEGVEQAGLWDRIVLTDREDRVVEALSIIEPDLERIVMVKAAPLKRDQCGL